MSFFERLRLAPKRAKQYAISPHRDEGNFARNTVGTNEHRYLKSKPLIKPIPKDDAQREDLHQYAKERLGTVGAKGRLLGRYARFAAARGLPRPMNRETAELAAYTDLFLRTRRGSARMNFAGISDRSPTVRLFAHGKAGRMALSSDTREAIPVEKVANFLQQLQFPKHALLKVNACCSGAGRKLNESSGEILRRYRDRSLIEIADIDHSFAANLHQIFTQKYGFAGATDGYLMYTLVSAGETLLPNDENGQHMVASFDATDAPGSPPIRLRKRDVRVRFV